MIHVQDHWTARMVAVYLEEAADTLRRLPEKRVQGYGSTWPDIVQDTWDAYGQSEARTRLGPPTARAIDQMDRTLPWLRWLDGDDQKLVWERANGRRWKAIAGTRGIDRSTAWRRWSYAVHVIAARLNAAADHGGESANRRMMALPRITEARHGR